MNKPMTKEKGNKVFDLLVSIGGADESKREEFISLHCEGNTCPTEWMIKGGKLGTGGKYKSTWNGVSYYIETMTPEINRIGDELNKALSAID